MENKSDVIEQEMWNEFR